MADLSFIGETRGTELQKMMEHATKRKLNSAALYSALAFIFEERGEEKYSGMLEEMADDELRHSTVFALLNGMITEEVAAHIEDLAERKNSELNYIADIAKQAENLKLDKTSKMIKSMYSEEAEHEQNLRDISEKIKK